MRVACYGRHECLGRAVLTLGLICKNATRVRIFKTARERRSKDRFVGTSAGAHFQTLKLGSGVHQRKCDAARLLLSSRQRHHGLRAR